MRFIQKRKNLQLLFFQPHVEVTLSTSNDTIIKSVLIFAEGIFEVKVTKIYLLFAFFFAGRKSRGSS